MNNKTKHFTAKDAEECAEDAETMNNYALRIPRNLRALRGEALFIIGSI